MSTRVMVDVPEVAFKGPHDTDAMMFRAAARGIEQGFKPGGGCVTAAVVALLRSAADALEAATWTVVRDETVDAPLFYVVQCSVCPVRAAVATQPDPSGWVCPRCAEIVVEVQPGGYGDPVRELGIRLAHADDDDYPLGEVQG